MMTSSSAPTSNTSLPTITDFCTKIQENEQVEAKLKDDNHKYYNPKDGISTTKTKTTTFNPITDLNFIENSARIVTTSIPATNTTTTRTASTIISSALSSISKIPYPLVSKTKQLQRTASLRLRNTKTKTPNLQPHNNGVNKMESQHSKQETTAGAAKREYKNITDSTHEAQTTTNSITADTNTATATGDIVGGGHFSTRRKLVLNNSYNSAIGLTRSLSLRKNYKFIGHKTDANKDLSEAAVAATTTPNPQAKDNNVDTHKGETRENGETNVDTTDCHINCVNGKAATIKNGLETNADSEEIQNMSTKLNGATTRPTTLVTATTAVGANDNSTTTATTSTTATATTPKTPTTQQQHHHQYNYHCCHKTTTHHHCTPKTNSHLTTVPETKLSPKTPPVTPDSPCTYLDDDLDSMYSFATTTSGRSTMSCEHPYVARNGTTFSGRKMKYVVHCSNYAGQVGPDYLTPTQRAQRQIRRLKEVLCSARQDLEQKDTEILRLTREVVELRLFKASLSSPEERSASSDAVTVREAELKTSQDVSPIVDMVDEAAKSSPRHIPNLHQHSHHHHHTQQQHNEMQSSFADSGHFEDLTSISVHSKDSSYAGITHDIACGNDEEAGAVGETNSVENFELQRQELIRMYEQRIEDLIRNQDGAISELKRTHNDRVEALLQKLAECNTRYADIVPDYEHAKERIRELEKQLEDLQRKLVEHEEKQNKMYLHMYQKGQESERIAQADQALELAHRAPNKVSINELLHQLQSTQDELENIRAAECRNECGSNHALLTAKEAISLWVLGARKTIYRRLLDAQKNRTHVDPEVTLQFLKSAVYYFLTDKENSQGHLQAIESILEFTEIEKQNIDKARSAK